MLLLPIVSSVQALPCRNLNTQGPLILFHAMNDMEMSYRGSSLKFHLNLTWNHVWDCLVVTDLRPIFSHLSSPLLSSPLSRSLELTPCGEGWWIPGFPKHVCWGSLLEGPIRTHTHTHTHTHTLWTTMLRPPNCLTPLEIWKVLHSDFQLQKWNWMPVCWVTWLC